MSGKLPSDAPDCDVANCPNARVVWRDGKRMIEQTSGNYVPHAAFVETALREILRDLDLIKEHLNIGVSGLVP